MPNPQNELLAYLFGVLVGYMIRKHLWEKR